DAGMAGRNAGATAYHRTMRRAILWLAVAGLAAFSQEPAAKVPLRLIVVGSGDEAAALRERVAGGADFAVLAREKSIDATSVDGGLLGVVDPSTLRDELRTAIRGLVPGQVSTVFRLPSGFAMVKVLAAGELAD